MTPAVPNTRTNDRAPRPAAQSAIRDPQSAMAQRKSEIRNPKSEIPSLLLAALLLAAVAGCGRGPGIIPVELRKPIDRAIVEFPADYELERFVTNLTAPSAMAFDTARNALLVAESGAGGREPRILGFGLGDGSTFTVYPQGRQFLGLRSIPFRMYGPIGGMTVRDGTIYVSHRDKRDLGVISAVTYEGTGSTVVGGLPARGDYGVTDVIFGPDGRLYFGVGAATNSGVVGLDNWAVGWVQRHPEVADRPFVPVRLRGSKFFTNNPRAGLFTGSELAITAPDQPFGVYYRTRIGAAPDHKPNAAIYSVNPTGGIAEDLRVEAHGIRYPLGLAFSRFDRLYASNQGMQLRGTRPVKDDPDTVLQIPAGSKRWLGWPDFTADLAPVTDEAFQPLKLPGLSDYLRRTGNTELTFLMEHGGELNAPDQIDRDTLVRGTFQSQSGAAKMTFVPQESAFGEYGDQLLVALSGDRAPFATMGRKPKDGPLGGKVVRLDVDPGSNKVVHDFIRNTAGVPRSKAGDANPDMLERPADVKVGPDGSLYVLDFGRLAMRGGKERITPRTGQVFRLRTSAATTTTAPVETDAGAQERAE